MNGLKTAILLGALTGLFLFAGAALGGRGGMMVAFILAMIMNLGAYWFSDKLVLRMYRAQPVEANDPTGLYEMTQELARRADIPMPAVYIVEDDSPNAFATGRNPANASVAATTGILRILNREELMGVMAHELSHVLNRDTLISAVSATIAGAISMLANMFMWMGFLFGGRDQQGHNPIVGLLLMILAPLAAGLIQMAISRSREFSADKDGAQLCKNPESLARALEKLEQGAQAIPFRNAQEHPATAHLFIVNPLKGMNVARLFSTHPSTEERCRRLRAMKVD